MSLAGYADIFLRNTIASGVVPQISAIMGPVRRRRCLFARSPISSSWWINTSHMFVTGPDVIKTVTHEDVTKERLGGGVTHNTLSGVAHFLAHGDAECLQHDPRTDDLSAAE